MSNLINKTYFHCILKAEDERHRRHPLEISNMEILHIKVISQRREPSIGKLQLKMEFFADMCLKLSDGLLKSICLPLFAGRSNIKGLSEEETCQ